MTKQEEFERIIVLKLQEIRLLIFQDTRQTIEMKLMQLEGMVKDHGQNPSIKP